MSWTHSGVGTLPGLFLTIHVKRRWRYIGTALYTWQAMPLYYRWYFDLRTDHCDCTTSHFPWFLTLDSLLDTYLLLRSTSPLHRSSF